MADDYNCTLDAASLKKAKEELNENPKDRLDAVKALREWLVKQPHIKSRTDTAFLLRVLRYKYFSQLESRKIIEIYWQNRRNKADWMNNIDTRKPEFLKAVDAGMSYILPGRTKEGKRIVIFDNGAFDADFKSGYSKSDMIKVVFAMYDYALMDEITQVNGMEIFADFTRTTLKHQNTFTMEDNRDFLQSMQGRYPIRLKGMHFYNPGIFMEWLMTIVRSFMAKKLKDRLVIHGNNLESVYKRIPMSMLPSEYLPDDYKGPCAGSRKDMIANLKKELTSDKVHAYLLRESDPTFCVDESKRPSDVPEGSFRKLNID